MRHAFLLTGVVYVAALGAAGCGGAPRTAANAVRSTNTSVENIGPASLEQAARAAVSRDHALAVESLWTNRVPANPQVASGPALATLRKSAVQRQKRGIRVRTVGDQFQVVGVQLNPSYSTATVAVRDIQGVTPYRNGRSLGRPVTLDQRAHFLLHRVGQAQSFVVWKVTEG
jgi:hypothetical protein